MNVCFYTHRTPIPTIGGVERVTYNLANYFRKIGVGVYNLTCAGDNSASVIPCDKPKADQISFINKYLLENKIDILIDQYGNLPLLEHPNIPNSVKIIYCYHLDPEGKHLIRSLFEVFSLKQLKYSLFNIACALNTPIRNYKSTRKLNRKINGGIDKIVYLSENYIPFVRERLTGPQQKFAAIPNAVEEKLLSTPPSTS